MSYEYSKVESLIAEGDYEARIENMEVKILPNGKEKLTIMYRIRDDVEQPYGNKCVFEDIWKEKDSPEHFNRKRLNMLLGTQDVKEGKVFDDINSIINYLIGSCVIIHVKKVFEEYYGEDRNRVGWYKSSNYKPKQIVETPVVDIKDDDLPF